MDISIVIVSYNARTHLEACLRSIYQHAPRCAFEIIVVDNNSSDESGRMVSELFPKVTLILNSDNTGFASANNCGFQEAGGRYLLLLNSDTEVMADALDHLVDFLDNNIEAGAIGCRLLNTDGSLQPSARRSNSFWSELFEHTYLDRFFPNSSFFNYHVLAGWDYQSVREVDWVTGACLMVRREVVKEVGPLDEGFFMYAEDAEWCYRIRRHGWKILFTPGGEIIHHGGVSSKPLFKEMEMEKYRSKYKLLLKQGRGGLMAYSFSLSCVSAATLLLIGQMARLIDVQLPNRLAKRAQIADYCLSQHMRILRDWLLRQERHARDRSARRKV